jgi:hypothetical protein
MGILILAELSANLVYPIQQIDAQAESLEELGTKRKFWYTSNGQRFLFKAEERGTGEDWAEKVVCELARRLGLPHVEYELAYFPAANLRGVICPNMAPSPRSLVMGNQLLGVLDQDYPKQIRKKFGVSKYTVEAVSSLLRLLLPPDNALMGNAPAGVESALGVFTGYMMLDTLVANQDRHHQNWGAILSDNTVRLAPTFDHGSSLARNLSDDEREDRLTTTNEKRAVRYFVGRALSEFYPIEAGKTLPVLEVFCRFAALVPTEARAWLGRLDELSAAQMDEILAQVPSERMSPLTRRFTLELLTLNKTRLLQSSTP